MSQITSASSAYQPLPSQAATRTENKLQHSSEPQTTQPALAAPAGYKPDQLHMQTTGSAASAMKEIALFDKPNSGSDKPWQVKTVHVNMGYVLDNQVIHSGPMRIQNAANGTDLTISDYQQADRKNWEYLKIEKGQRFAPDEPQFNVGVNMTFNNKFGVEVDAKHNKITMAGYDQEVRFDGQLNGEEIHQTAPLNTVMRQHEQTLGNMQISALATYTFDLPAPGNHKLSWITKAGPSLITTNTRTQIKGPGGEFEGGTGSLELSGYGATLENGLRYQFGPKVAQLGLELSHSLSYLNYANYQSAGGYSGSHSAINSSVALKATIGLYGNKK